MLVTLPRGLAALGLLLLVAAGCTQQAETGPFTEFTPEDAAPFIPGPWPDRLIAESRHTFCALKREGEIRCWGDGLVISAEPPSGPWLGIDGDDQIFCGVRRNGEGECWRAWIAEEPVEVPLGPRDAAVQVEMRYSEACWLLADGSVDCDSAYVDLDWDGPVTDFGRCGGLTGLRPGGEFARHPPSAALQRPVETRFKEVSGCYHLTTEGVIVPMSLLDPPEEDDEDGWEAWEIPGTGYVHLFPNTLLGWPVCGMYADGDVQCHEPPFNEDRGEESVELRRECIDPPGPWLAVTVRCQRGCGIRPDWRVECWGCGESNRIGGQFEPSICEPPNDELAVRAMPPRNSP